METAGEYAFPFILSANVTGPFFSLYTIMFLHWINTNSWSGKNYCKAHSSSVDWGGGGWGWGGRERDHENTIHVILFHQWTCSNVNIAVGVWENEALQTSTRKTHSKNSKNTSKCSGKSTSIFHSSTSFLKN